MECNYQRVSVYPYLRILDLGHTMLISCLVYTLTISYYGHGDDLKKFTCLNSLILFGSAITWIEQVCVWSTVSLYHFGIDPPIKNKRFSFPIAFGKSWTELSSASSALAYPPLVS